MIDYFFEELGIITDVLVLTCILGEVDLDKAGIPWPGDRSDSVFRKTGPCKIWYAHVSSP